MNETLASTGRRVHGDVVTIDYEATHGFFEERATRALEPDALTTVLYQDAHPEVAAARHAYEVEHVSPFLGLSRGPRVLDIGCGNGRWARALAGRVRGYLGIDFSALLVEQSRQAQRCYDDSHAFVFQELSATDLAPSRLAVAPPFDLIVIAGVLVYLNDADVAEVLEKLPSLVSQDAVVYLREPVALQDRLTLDAFASEELNAAYSAVYRRADFYRGLLGDALDAHGFRVVIDDAIPTQLGNRAETTQHYFVHERASQA